MFTWQSHLGICSGDGRCLQAHEVVKLSLKRLAFSSPDLGGIAITSHLLLVEPRHMRSDDTRPGDIYVMAGGSNAKDVAVDLIVSFSMSSSTLLHSSKSADRVLMKGENIKFSHNLRNLESRQLSATQCFIPLVMKQCGRRGPHFEADLEGRGSGSRGPLFAACSKALSQSPRP